MKKTIKIEIEIPSHWKSQIAKDLNTTTQTVRMSLSYVNNSSLALQIRQKALKKLNGEFLKHKEYNFD